MPNDIEFLAALDDLDDSTLLDLHAYAMFSNSDAESIANLEKELKARGIHAVH